MDQNKSWTISQIEKTSQSLVNKTLDQFIAGKALASNKGGVGQLIETDVFHLKNNNDMGPDFAEAGVELKVIPLKNLKKGVLVPKERMVLTLINYMKDYKYSFYESHLYNKTKMMQIIQYHHNYNDLSKSLIVNQFMYSFPAIDLKIIEDDYNYIIGMIKDGRAHELSEGSTMYLGAVTKGAGGVKDLVKQPFSDVLAKRRAFSLKTNYLRLMNKRLTAENELIFKTINDYSKKVLSFQEMLNDKVKNFVGHDVNELCSKFGINVNSKNYLNTLGSKILGIETTPQKAGEFVKAGVTAKTIRIINGTLKESMSFKKIDFDEIQATSWEDYWLYNVFSNMKFAFFIYEGTTESLKFKGIKMWNMPQKDIDKYKYVYENAKKTSLDPNGTWKDKFYRSKFTKSSEHEVGHIRPHGRDSKDVVTLPSGNIHPNQGWWLNKKYILKEISKK